MVSVQGTIQRFWTTKRLLVLVIFALAWGNVVLYSVSYYSKKHVVDSVVMQQQKIHASFLQALEANAHSRDPANEIEALADAATAAAAATLPMPPSRLEKSLSDVRKLYPSYKIELLQEAEVETDRDKKVLEMLKNRPKGWRFTDETDGWARSSFALSSATAQNMGVALQVISYVRDDLQSWQSLALSLGAYSFAIFLFFGWVWSRALDFLMTKDMEGDSERAETIRHKMAALNRVVEEIGKVVSELRVAVQRVEKISGGSQAGVVHVLEEICGQIRMLSLNASVEAARSPEAYRTFSVLTQEIGVLADRAKEHVTRLGTRGFDMTTIRQKIERVDAIMSGLADSEHEPSGEIPASSKRRAG